MKLHVCVCCVCVVWYYWFVVIDLMFGLQVARAKQRLQGAQLMMSILSQDTLLPSVVHSAVCGWNGIFDCFE